MLQKHKWNLLNQVLQTMKDCLNVSLPKCPRRWIAATEEQTPRLSCTRYKKFHTSVSVWENPKENLINSSSETPPSPLMSRAWKSSLARSRGSNLVQSRSGSRTWFLSLPLVSQILQLTWKSVGGTNPSRADNFSSEAPSTENVVGTPPHVTHIWIQRDVRTNVSLQKLAQVNLEES